MKEMVPCDSLQKSILASTLGPVFGITWVSPVVIFNDLCLNFVMNKKPADALQTIRTRRGFGLPVGNYV